MRSDENTRFFIQLNTAIAESCKIEFVLVDGNKGPWSILMFSGSQVLMEA